ncbi:hypothetical protein BH11PSE12_BH11PSE12_15980 [soil metagenome]
MVKERNARIAAFQKISGYLLCLYKPIVIFFYFILSAVVVSTIFAKNGEISLTQFLIKLSANGDVFDMYFNTGVSLLTKLVFTTAMVIFMVICIIILYHFKKLIACFNDGNIFSRSAVHHARKAYKMNLLAGFCGYGAELAVVIVGFTYADSGNGHRLWELCTNVLGFAVEIGFLSLILWALEMGTDLNEESELTI